MSVLSQFLFERLSSILCGGALLLLIMTIWVACKPGLRSIPGPSVAKFTNLWRFLKVAQGDFQTTIVAVHRQYGEVVRIGPKAVSLSNPEAIEIIYGLKANFPKSKFYDVIMATNKGKPVETFFTTQRIKYHAALKKPVKNSYAMTTITDYEPHIDKTLKYFIERLESVKGTVCDIGQWFHFYSFDVISTITWSDRMGFLDRGSDIDGLIQTLETDMDYNAPVGQIPWLDKLLKKNILFTLLAKSSTFSKLATEKIDERYGKSHWSTQEKKDFLSKFINAKRLFPQTVGDQEIISYMVTNIVAGSDTTAISLRAVLYYLLMNPRCYHKVRREIEEKNLPEGPISWASSQEMPYLDVCIKEAFRMHPAVGLLLERVAPQDITLPGGENIPAGTIVGINAWAIHRNSRVFGEKVDEYIPERWLRGDSEDEEAYQVRVRSMKRADLTFGHGIRTCLGKNIGLMETYKTIATLLRSFDVEFANDEGWALKNAWFVRQSNFKVILKSRT